MATLVNDSILKNDAAGPVPVSGGLGTDSYYNHSFFQKIAANVAKDMIDEAIAQKLDVPEGLEDKNSPAWNKGRIHHASAAEEVRRAYAVQWANDLSNFLNARAREIVPGGIIVIVTHSIPDGMEYSELANGMMYNCMASILLDIAKRRESPPRERLWLRGAVRVFYWRRRK
ncbi:hypothetical protein NC653_021245 [Populus alba x Populus x berolinensis]|uniref:Uncharacterized protein n=1 Tax=Populus alba x Populus x berolinensis TaxID=444605 RepID=A0AAD6QDK1_9ROSI|nr:hypothetical protein NC653_021245 [Populus alba x Populus x berolinensis]